MSKNKNKQHREYIYNKYNFTCVACKLKFSIPKDWDFKSALYENGICLEIDHIIPLSKGGSDLKENKQAMCQKCNNKKSNKL